VKYSRIVTDRTFFTVLMVYHTLPDPFEQREATFWVPSEFNPAVLDFGWDK
jgi:hypothetical protein